MKKVDEKINNRGGKGIKNSKLTKAILLTIATVGLIGMAVLAPNALQALSIFMPSKDRRFYITKRIHFLEGQGLIEFKKKNSKTFVRLTDKGKERVLKYQLGELKIKKPKWWDGKWRVIIFDIKEYKRHLRDELRAELISLGFKRVQNSVWVHPYDCEEVITLLKSHFNLGKEVLYMKVNELENDRWLKKEFGLA